MKTNQVILIGYVGQDLVDTTTQKGSKRVSIRVATHHTQKGENGVKKWHTVWHDIIAWDQVADYALGNFVKGSRIMVDGSIIYRTYPDHTGHIRYLAEINAAHLVNLDR